MSNNIVDHAKRYLEFGWRVVPLQFGEKNPVIPNWQSLVLERSELERTFGQGDTNIGANLGDNSGGLIDTDLETLEVIQAAEWYLLHTDAVFGRASKRRSHRFYVVKDEKAKRVQFVDPMDGKLLLEIRGSGHQTMVPPSIHPSGEQLEWEVLNQALETTYEDLVLRCGMAAASAFFIRHWSEWNNGHHNLIMHLAGGLFRADWSLEHVEHFVKSIVTLCGDHEPNDRIEAVRSTYTKHQNGEETTGWQSLSEYVPAPALVRIREWLNIRTKSSGFKMTDEGNAQRLAHYFGEDIRFCPQWQKWLIWNGQYWETDETERIVNLMRETVEKIFMEGANEPDPDKREKLVKFGIYSQNVSRMLAAPRLARSVPDLIIHSDDLNPNAWVLNVSNGTVDLKTGGARPHSKTDYITKIANVRYESKAEHPEWTKFLNRVLPDEKTRRFVQKAVGYTATGLNTEQVFFMLYGETQNGKSTFLNAINYALGKYAMAADVSTFVQTQGDRIRTDIARLQGARLVTSTEPDEGQRLAAALIKKITGGDDITSRFLYGQEFSYKASYTIWIATNYKLKIKSADAAIWRRLRFIPFTVTIPEEERDLKLEEKLQKERNGILNWIIAGAQMWNNERLGSSEEVDQAQTGYRSESDTVTQFLNAECEKTEGAEVGAARLFAAYKQWCTENNEKSVTSTVFKDRMLHAGFTNKRKETGYMWLGLELHQPTLTVLPMPGVEPTAPPQPEEKEDL